MIRAVLAVIASIVTWFVVASLGNVVLRLALPGYAEVEKAMAFTLSMQVARLVLGLVSSLCAGYVCALVARIDRMAEKVVAVLLVLLFIPVHYMLWDKFPAWYHAFFLITLAPAVLLGAALTPRAAAASPPSEAPHR